MSILNITPEDFVDKYELAVNELNYASVQRYIDRYEDIYLKNLLGCDLFNLFQADLAAGIPQDPIYIVIFNEICKDLDDKCKTMIRSEGMVEMIKGFTYFYYVREAGFPNTTTGNVKADNENSEPVTFSQMGLELRYNTAIKTYKNIQFYIKDNDSDYPEFNGIEQEIIGIY